MTVAPLVYADTILPEQSGYAPARKLTTAFDRGEARRAWLVGGEIVSMQMKDGSLWKTTERLAIDDTQAPATLARLQELGVHHPSSWASCFDQLSPLHYKMKFTHNGLFMDWHGGPWHEALKTGRYLGPWWRYDLRSAYRWAATLGLPSPDTFVVRDEWHDDPGLWRYHWPVKPFANMPRTLRESKDIVVSSAEIEAYGLPTRGIVRGVTWSKSIAGKIVTDVLDLLPKACGRAYWGKWAARDPLRCWTPKRTWELNNHRLNLVWAWLLVGRVRLRVWQVSKEAAHVYVDEVVVPHQLPTGDIPGSWRLKEEFSSGIDVERTGSFRHVLSTSYSMRTGVKRQ